ncbi:hypothetical protein CH373_12375 [Leptospira perolatii]|uniref:Methyltransferase type 11 domain-containing protein n=1 Tax=Leptospira perolatii TaxID=2023191 RepID=A0A2M9ZLE5_9LEPT|nr:methyltransferase domain-containing protein [Leptospira perolatii]PJZ70267.1 hypothetical protein CH360_06595 [Leptospira perolatii]PJZ72849.1 hypothetical protein CH373_12375 [Leptospira perolatii]
MKLLNLGCGVNFHPAWTNVDFVKTGEGVIKADLRRGIPFASASIDVVYHSHVLEHFEKSDAILFLKECYRVLKPGGILRIVVPDLERTVREYLRILDSAVKEESSAGQKYSWIVVELIDQLARNQSGGLMASYWKSMNKEEENYVKERVGEEPFRNPPNLTKNRSISNYLFSLLRKCKNLALKLLLGREYHSLRVGRFRLNGEPHLWMYDRFSLPIAVASAGFAKPRIADAFRSSIPNFHEYGLDVDPEGNIRKPDSLFLEAIKS